MILNGAIIRKERLKKSINEVQKMVIKPKLTIILIGKNSASKIYVNNKVKFATEVGIEVELIEKPENYKQEELLRLIERYNRDPFTNGLFIQLPLPNHINEEKVINLISPIKDIDGFSHDSLGKLVVGDKNGFTPCTVAGIVNFLEYYNIDPVGKNICIVGRSNIVGKPLAIELINKGATVTVCNSKTKDLKYYSKNADIFISAIGKAKFFDESYFKIGQTLIDVGMNRDENNKLCGDIDFDTIDSEKINITPVPGGVGVLTVVNVIENVIKAYKMQNK